jgi:hypothetical protein
MSYHGWASAHIAELDSVRRIIRAKWTDGHRVYWSMTNEHLTLEMPSVDLKMVAIPHNDYWMTIFTCADVDYIAGYWRD